MKPTGKRLLIRVEKPKQQTESGLYISEDWKTLPPKGEVLAVGPEVGGVKKGQRVVFDRFGSVILDDDQRLCIEDQIFGVLDEG